MNAYEQRKQDRIDRLQERAAKKQVEADRLVNAGSEALAHIPFGQPILVGHHSEKGDRAYRGRAIGQIDRGMRASREADELAARAAAAESNTSISSDDPDAPEKLRAWIAKLEATHAEMLAVNKIIRRKPKGQPTPEKLAALVDMGLTAATAAKVFEPDCCGCIGIPA